MTVHANDLQADRPTRFGAYLCFEQRPTVNGPEIAQRLGLTNEFDAHGGDPPDSIAFLKRLSVTPGQRPDEALGRTRAIVHVASANEGTITAACEAMQPQRALRGVVRPMSFTSRSMFNFSYAHRVLQQPGTVMRHVFFVPMSKTADWWAKDWLERHTYFLPRYDDAGHMRNEGHALAAAAGIPVMLRRTYKHEVEPAPADAYDFLTYFECADADVDTFFKVCEALRDTQKNPEWQFVREGPTWHGQRVASWEDLFD